MNENLHLSPSGRASLRIFEGRRSDTYLDTGGIATAGTGHTGPDVVMGQHYGDAQIDAWENKDIADSEADVRHAVTAPLTQHQFDACVSLAFNIGDKNFGKSSIARYLNAGDAADAAKSFVLWDHARVDGKLVEVDGLRRRRLAEAAIFSTPDATGIEYVEMQTTIAPAQAHPAAEQGTFHPENSGIGTVETPPGNNAHTAVTIGSGIAVVSATVEQFFEKWVPIHDIVIGLGFTQHEVLLALAGITIGGIGYAGWHHFARARVGIA